MADCIVQVENDNDEETTEIHNLTDNVVKQYNINIIEIDILNIIKHIFYVIILTFICPVIIGICIFTVIYLSDHFNKTYSYHDFMNKHLFEIWFMGFVITLILLLIKAKRK
uniref:Uncharacterized protein n=1 Tax=viral metagenome TaxID=1070528 RepID=A0A6C0C767_9ZZZZ